MLRQVSGSGVTTAPRADLNVVTPNGVGVELSPTTLMGICQNEALEDEINFLSRCVSNTSLPCLPEQLFRLPALGTFLASRVVWYAGNQFKGLQRRRCGHGWIVRSLDDASSSRNTLTFD